MIRTKGQEGKGAKGQRHFTYLPSARAGTSRFTFHFSR